MVFTLAHSELMCAGLIAIPTEVQYAMKYHPVHFATEGLPQLPGVLAHPVGADIHLSTQFAGNFRNIKGDDIGVVIMVQILAVDLEEVFIGAENNIEIIQPPALFPDEAIQKSFEPVAIPQGDGPVG